MAKFRATPAYALLITHAFRQASCLSKNSQVPFPLPQLVPDIEDIGSLSQRTSADADMLYGTNQTNLVVYLHVPQSGSGFATTVAHHACGSDIPDDVLVREPSKFFEEWGPACNESRFGRFQSGHYPLTAADMNDLGNVVAMFREPSQRLISGYYNDLYGCTRLQQKHKCLHNVNGSFVCEGDSRGINGRFVRNPSIISPIEYGRCMANCTANMLTGRPCGTKGLVDVERAVGSVDELGFVGITEEWNLSLCLWHARFGGRVLPAELKNVRPGTITASTGESQSYDDRAFLAGWYPSADEHIFHAATKRFWNDLDLHRIDRGSCMKMMSGLAAEQSSELVIAEQTIEDEQMSKAVSEATVLTDDMLVEHVGFLGLKDEWALSICLWHKRFNGSVTPFELTSAQSNFSGPAEGTTETDAEARRRFFSEVQQLGVDPFACAAVESMYNQRKGESGFFR